MFVVGVDENGLGPRLGPLVVTGAVIEVEAYEARRLARAGKRIGIDDSKQTSSFGDMANAEGLVMALVEHLTGVAPTHADQLLEAIGLDSVEALRAPCPEGATSQQCWGGSLDLPAFDGDIVRGRRQLKRLVRRGVRLVQVRTAVACPKILNRELAAGRNKLQVNLSLFERILLDARRTAPEDVYAHCGMVGGIRNYPGYFTHFDPSAVEARSEDQPVYRIAGIGEVSFEVSADANHLPVSLASMVGKYVRELAMARINRFYRSHDDSLAPASGYHDPVTTRFIQNTKPARQRLKIEEPCFQRLR